MNMEEIWKDVIGFEEAYQVSNLGNVRSKDRVVVTEWYKRRVEKGKHIKLRHDKDGYLVFNAKWECKSKMLKVHREVAKCFIENQENLPCVDHIDGIRDNNVYTNLRWCTVKQNASFPLAKENKRNATTKSYENNEELRKLRAETFRKTKSKKIEVYYKGLSVGVFNSQLEASKALKISQSAISAQLYGRLKTCKGFTFKNL